MEVQHCNVALLGPHRLTQITQTQDNVSQKISRTQIWEDGRAHELQVRRRRSAFGASSVTLCPDYTPDQTIGQTQDQTLDKTLDQTLDKTLDSRLDYRFQTRLQILDQPLDSRQDSRLQTFSDHIRPFKTVSDLLKPYILQFQTNTNITFTLTLSHFHFHTFTLTSQFLFHSFTHSRLQFKTTIFCNLRQIHFAI